MACDNSNASKILARATAVAQPLPFTRPPSPAVVAQPCRVRTICTNLHDWSRSAVRSAERRDSLGRGSVNVNRKSQSLRPGLLALLALCLGALDAPAYAQAPPVTLAWDGNPEPSVAGYIVYVGNASGSYGEQYDVGDQTSFAYTRVSAGRPYYFAVAAYTPGREVGERSEEIFFLSGAATGLAPSVPVRVASQLTASSPDNRRARCASASDTGCYSVERLVSLAGDASALTPALNPSTSCCSLRNTR